MKLSFEKLFVFAKKSGGGRVASRRLPPPTQKPQKQNSLCNNLLFQTFFTLNRQQNNEPTLFENYSKCRLWIWDFRPIFVLLILTCLVTLFDRKLQVFKNSPKLTILGIFNKLLSTQNVNVARFARNVEWDFFCDFQTLWAFIVTNRQEAMNIFVDCR